MSNTRNSKITPELITFLFGVGIPNDKEMLQKTTQRCLFQSILPLTRLYILYHLYLHRNELAGKWTLDHLESIENSIRDSIGALVFNNVYFVEAYAKPSKDQHEADDSLQLLCTYFGVPIKFKSYMSSSFEGLHAKF